MLQMQALGAQEVQWAQACERGPKLQMLLMSRKCLTHRQHTCHKLWTEICEINQNYKGDVIKFPLALPKNTCKQKVLILM